ncbi:MAG TPA: hypothetical protein DCO93_01015 [Clostridiales bacterium]|nr:hypothetical protein [Clostridiales bacterium]
MRNDQNYFNSSDDWCDIIIIFLLIVYGGAFCLFMYHAFMVDYSNVFFTIIRLFIGFFVYVYSAAFITFAIQSIIVTIRKFRKKGFTWTRLIICILSIVVFVAGQLVPEFLYWGIIQKNDSLRNMWLPALVITIPCAIIYFRCLMSEE